MSSLAHEPGVDTIDTRLVHCVQNTRHILPKFCLRHEAGRMTSPKLSGYLFCERCFITRLPCELREGQRHGLNIRLASIPHEAHERTGVDTGRKECSDWNIGG